MIKNKKIHACLQRAWEEGAITGHGGGKSERLEDGAIVSVHYEVASDSTVQTTRTYTGADGAQTIRCVVSGTPLEASTIHARTSLLKEAEPHLVSEPQPLRCQYPLQFSPLCDGCRL